MRPGSSVRPARSTTCCRAGFQASKRVLVADREYLAAFDRERRDDWRARQRADRSAAQKEVGAFVRREGRSGPAYAKGGNCRH